MPVAKAVPAAVVMPKIESAEAPVLNKFNETAVTKPDIVQAVSLNEDLRILNALNGTESPTKPLEHSTITAALEKRVETVKTGNTAAADEELKAQTEIKAENAENAAKADGAANEPSKNDAALENGEQNLFDGASAETDDDPEQKDHPEEKNEGEYDDYGAGDGMARDNNNIPEVKIPQDLPEPTLVDDVPHKKVVDVNFEEDPDSNFFTYLCALMFLCVLLYILHQNRQKILALFIEGRRGNRRGSRDRSRGGSKAAYSKLDCNLEEAIMSKSKSLSGKSMDIIY